MPLDQEPGTAGKSALFLTIMGLLSQGIGFLYRVLLSRIVGAEVMGLYQLLMPVYSVMVALTAVGVTAATAHLTALFLAQGQRGAVAQTLRWATTLFLLSMLPVSLIVFTCSDGISVELLGDARTQLGLLLLVPCVALTGLENIYKHYFYGAGLVKPPAFTELLEQFVRGVAVVGLLLLFPVYPERQVGLIVVGMVVCEVFSASVLILLYRRQRGSWAKEPPSPGLVGKMGHIALPVGASALLGTLMGAANAALIPRLLVEGGMVRSVAMSSFGVLCGMTLPMLGLPTVLLGALNLVLIPRQARSLALGQWDQIRRRTHKALLAVSVSMLPAMGLLAVVGGDLGLLLFSDPRVGEYLLPLAVASALGSYQSTLFALLNGIGKQTVTALLSLLAGGMQLLATLILVPRWGLEGFVLGLLCLSGFHTLLQGYCVLRFTGARLRFFDWFTAPGLSALLMGLCCNLLYGHLKEAELPLLWSVLLCSFFGGGLYLLCLWAQGVSIHDILSKEYKE